MSAPFSVPAEYLGKARAFRARIGAEDAAVGQAVQRIAAPLEARRKRKPTFRPETLIDAERQFRQLPAVGRLVLKIERDKHKLKIEEFRVAAGTFRFCSWVEGATDPDLGVVRIDLLATPFGPVGATANLVASISMHALGRRVQRGFQTSDPVILGELREIALRHAEIVKTAREFSIAFDGGTWVGEAVKAAGFEAPVLAIRSFVPVDMPVRGVAFAA